MNNSKIKTCFFYISNFNLMKISNQELERILKTILLESPQWLNEININREWEKLKNRIVKWEHAKK